MYATHPENRIGDHIWWISDLGKFKQHYPGWGLTFTIEDILMDIMNTQRAVMTDN